MTNKEYLTGLVSKFGVSELDIDMILTSQGLNGDSEADVKAVEEAAYNEFKQLIPIQEVAEGDLSIKWNMTGLKLWYSLLAKKLDKPDLLAELNAPDNEVNDASFTHNHDTTPILSLLSKARSGSFTR